MQKMQEYGEGLKTEELTAFVAVVENNGFTGAAQVLGRNATVISRRIQQLETQLGTRLLARSTRHVALTEAGELFYSRVRRLLDDMRCARLEVSEFAEAPRGLLRISLPVTYGRRWIVPGIRDFIVAYPGIKLDLRFTDRMTDLVAENIDMAVRVGKLTDSALVSRTIIRFGYQLVASPDYLRRCGIPTNPEDLTHHSCLKFISSSGKPDWILSKGANNVTVRPDGPIQSDNSEALLQAALDGLGIALIPEWLATAELRQGTLQHVLPQWQGNNQGGVYAILPPGRLIPAKTRVFLDHIINYIREQ